MNTSYRNVTGEERAVILAKAPPPADMPPYGVIVKVGDRTYLYYRNVVGYLYVIDVTGNVPAHFSQNFPPPASFTDDVLAGVGAVGRTVEKYLLIVAVLLGLYFLASIASAMRR